MRRRTKLLIVVACLAATAAIVALLTSAYKEPQYHGHPLSYWTCLYTAARYPWQNPGAPITSSSQNDATEAVRAIGPAAVPHLVRWIGYYPPNANTPFTTFIRRHRPAWLPRWILDPTATDQAWLRALSASDAFKLLGPSARSAVPALLRRARHVRNSFGIQAIVKALGDLGPEGVVGLGTLLTTQTAEPTPEAAATARREAILLLIDLKTNAVPAVPTLVRCLRDRNESIATLAATALASLGLRPDLAVPALAGALEDPRPMLRIAASEALALFGDEARPAVPALLTLRLSPDPEVQKAATNALEAITPEALTSAPPQ